MKECVGLSLTKNHFRLIFLVLGKSFDCNPATGFAFFTCTFLFGQLNFYFDKLGTQCFNGLSATSSIRNGRTRARVTSFEDVLREMGVTRAAFISTPLLQPRRGVERRTDEPRNL